jgi:transposase
MSKVEVITGAERRRHWTNEQKLRILEEAFGPDGVVAETARRAGLCTGQIYRWRKELCAPAQGFSRAVVAGPVDYDRSAAAPIEIDLGDIRVRIAANAPRDLVACVIKGLTRP